jgi:phosphatidylethanolamine/phosphatidyl-N-methylethanolamine N-methyltransferase
MHQQNFDQHYDSEFRRHENKLFFKQWIKHPGRLGTVAPISVKLARTAAAQVSNKGGYVVEIGAGTGRLTRALLERGVSSTRLAVVELDPKLCTFLKDTLPALCLTSDAPQIIEGDAAFLPDLIPSSWVGSVETVVSAIPLMYLPEDKRLAIIEAAFKILKPGGKIIHITYNPKSPLAFSRAYTQERVVGLWMNMPPGFVWSYTKKENDQMTSCDEVRKYG